MTRMFLGLIGAGILAATAAHGADAPKSKVDDLFPDKVLARGTGVEVKQSEVEAEFLAYKMEVAVTGGDVPDARRPEIEKKILDRLVVTRILLNKATDADKKKAAESVEKFIAKAREQAGTEDAYKRQVEARGLSVDEFQRKLLERTIAEEVYTSEVKSKVVISDADVKKFYDDNPEKFKQPELLKVAHILKLGFDPRLRGVQGANAELSDDEKKLKRKEIEAVLKRARDGEDFAALAKETSEDPSVKQNNGEYTFSRGQMAVEFETAAFALGVNQISDVVATKSGFHIIKMLEKTPAQKLEFEKVKDKIKDYLAQQESDKQVPIYTEKVKKEAGVEYSK